MTLVASIKRPGIGAMPACHGIDKTEIGKATRKIPAILIGALALLLVATSAWAQQKSLVISDTDLHLTEGGRFSFSMRLNSQPTSDVTVTVEPARESLLEVNTSLITDGAQNAEKKNTLTFTDSNWNEDQTVTVFSLRDSDSADESTQVNGGFDNATGTVRVSVMDADASGLVVSEKWMGFWAQWSSRPLDRTDLPRGTKSLSFAFLNRESAKNFRDSMISHPTWNYSFTGVEFKSGSNNKQFTVAQ
ncbi:MAG: hypothetical protein ISN28_09780 [Ectothiorhodospiraceae bacterium AqS1]|nr:hypothetical protein [Ectothiorhodospiraceae bacterium AqS1]